MATPLTLPKHIRDTIAFAKGMAMTRQDIGAIRADLSRRVAAIPWHAGAAGIAAEVDAIRAIAHRHAMLPAVAITRLLASALARGERGAMVRGWLAMLHEAVASERQDADASDIFTAACTVRFAG